MEKIVNTENIGHDWNQTKIFGGSYSGFQRFDVFRHEYAKKAERIMRGAFWIPEEVSLQDDKLNFRNLPKDVQELFIENILFQTFADSVQSRGIESVFAEECTDPAWEPVFRTWGYFEVIHSLSYSHIIRSIFPNPTKVFDSLQNRPMITNRFLKEIEVYSEGDMTELLFHVLALEGVKFFVSFLVTYVLNENYGNAIPNVSRIIKLIQHDELLHTSISAELIKIIKDDPTETNGSKVEEIDHVRIFNEVVEQEIGWGEHLLSICNLRGISLKEIEEFVKYRADKTITLAGLNPIYDQKKTYLCEWFENYSDINVENVAQQESRALAYNIGTLQNDL